MIALMCYTCDQVKSVLYVTLENRKNRKILLTPSDTCVMHQITDFLIYNRKYIQSMQTIIGFAAVSIPDNFNSDP